MRFIISLRSCNYRASKAFIFLMLVLCFLFFHLDLHAKEISENSSKPNLEVSSNIDSSLLDKIYVALVSLLSVSSGEMLFPVSFSKNNLDDELYGGKYLNQFKNDFPLKNTEQLSHFLDQDHTFVAGIGRQGRSSKTDDSEEDERQPEEEEEEEEEEEIFYDDMPSLEEQPEDEFYDMPPLILIAEAEGSREERLQRAFKELDYNFIIGYFLKVPDSSETVFRLACEFCAERVVSILLFLGVSPYAELNEKKQVALHLSVKSGSLRALNITEKLIEVMNRGIDVQDADSDTPLHIAAKEGKLLQARLLLKNGDGFHKKNKNGETPAIIAKNNKHDRLERLISSKFFINKDDIREEEELDSDIDNHDNDEEISDTDSEDESDYEDYFVDPVTLIQLNRLGRGFVRDVNFQGMLNDQRINFQEERIDGNNDCGFTGLGIERDNLRYLLNYVNDENFRNFIMPEIVGAIMDGHFLPNMPQYFLNDIDRLRKLCFTESVVRAYLEALIHKKNMWIGRQTMLAYAKARDIRLYIWSRPSILSNNLILLAHNVNEVQNPSNIINLLYTSSTYGGPINHFNLLVRSPGQTELANQGSSSPIKKAKHVDKKYIVPHFRGIHFHRNHFAQSQRKWFLYLNKLRHQGVVFAESLFSPASYELAKLSFVPDKQKVKDYNVLLELLQKRGASLKEASLVVKNKIRGLQESGPTDPTFFKGSTSRNGCRYKSLYYDYLQRYVNTHSGIKHDMKIAKGKKRGLDGRSSKRTRRKWEELADLSFVKLPFVSTSEDVGHPLKYAVAANDNGSTVLAPQYQSDGYPRFPYLGLVYVIMHSCYDNGLAEKNSSRILELAKQKLIDINIGRRGAQRERVFIGSIDAEHVPIAVVIRVPNFSHDYKKIYSIKYGLSEWQFNDFKKRLAEGKNRLSVEKEIIKHVVDFKTKEILKIAKALAKAKGGRIVYFGVDSSSGNLLLKPSELKDFNSQ